MLLLFLPNALNRVKYIALVSCSSGSCLQHHNYVRCLFFLLTIAHPRTQYVRMLRRTVSFFITPIFSWGRSGFLFWVLPFFLLTCCDFLIWVLSFLFWMLPFCYLVAHVVSLCVLPFSYLGALVFLSVSPFSHPVAPVAFWMLSFDHLRAPVLHFFIFRSSEGASSTAGF